MKHIWLLVGSSPGQMGTVVSHYRWWNLSCAAAFSVKTAVMVYVLIESIWSLTLSVLGFPMGSRGVKFLTCCASILLCATTGPTMSRNRLNKCLRRNTFPGGIPSNLARLSSVKLTSRTCDRIGCVMFMECSGSPSMHHGALYHPGVQCNHQDRYVSANQKPYWLAIATPDLLPM